MDSLKDIIERCHQRHQKPLRQRKTRLIPTLYDQEYPYHFKVYCAHRYAVLLSDMEQANISFIPAGRAPQHDRGPRHFGGDRFLKRQGIKDWNIRRWQSSWGIQIYSGIPSEHDGARWHDLHFTYQAICTAPDAVFACVEALVNSVENPLLTITKSGGLRFSCRVLDYLHPDAEMERLYIYKHTPTPENPHQRDVYLQILGEERCSRWDARYEILLGNLLDPPVISEEILFGPIEALRAELHVPDTFTETKLKKPSPPTPLSLGSHPLDLAKEAFLKRGYLYVRQENGKHYWKAKTSKVEEEQVSLWDQDGTLWICASTPDLGLPTEPTPITNIWDDTGILPPIPATGLPVSEEVLAVREGKLSPLGIKRPSPILQKSEQPKKVYRTLAENSEQIQHVFNQTARIVSLITETTAENNYEMESYTLKGGNICLNLSNDVLANKTEQNFQIRNGPSFARWKPRMYLWDQIKEIPIDVRMENPFQHGNVCEDAERCDALEKKGGNPRESICPHCPVYIECQQHGYLSQPPTLQRAKAQISSTYRLFFNPKHTETVEEMLKPEHHTERLCIINDINPYQLFLKCKLSKEIIKEWVVNWEGNVLGKFANALLNVLEIRDRFQGGIVKRVRTTMQTFEWQKEVLVQQMCQVNVQGRVVKNELIEAETGKELASFCIEFEGGISAYIPSDNDAADRLKAMELPHFELQSFELNVNMKIPMAMEQAITLGILNTDTVDNIDKFPTVCRKPNWTYWHQLKHFFAYYTRDVDAPMQWDNEVLCFKVPPILPQHVNRLLMISTNLPEQSLRKAFPNEKIEVSRIEPAAWLQGNQVFQIRSGDYSRETIFDHENNWDVIGMSEIGLRLFSRIRSEIEGNPNIQHAIISYRPIVQYLVHFCEKENVRLVTHFKDKKRFATDLEKAGVIWVVGTPSAWAPAVTWHRAQILYGNDEKPLCYEEERESGRYKDERVQNVYDQDIIRILTKIVGHVGLNRTTDKKVVLITSFPIPDITDRPETFLFDWEDFEVADSLDKLPETIAKREHFEKERDNLTAESGRAKVEHILGCSSSKANRILRKFRGGKLLRVPLREQIFSSLTDGEKKTAELMEAIEGHPTSVKNELKRLVDIGEVEKVRRGVYKRPEDENSN